MRWVTTAYLVGETEAQAQSCLRAEPRPSPCCPGSGGESGRHGHSSLVQTRECSVAVLIPTPLPHTPTVLSAGRVRPGLAPGLGEAHGGQEAGCRHAYRQGPVALTTNVPQGKVSPTRRATTPDRQQRPQAPTAPPIATSRKSVMRLRAPVHRPRWCGGHEEGRERSSGRCSSGPRSYQPGECRVR